MTKNKIHRSSANTGGSLRIISGKWKRRKLPIINIKKNAPDGFRPTPDRLRETLFNWLGQNMHGLHFLDVFAGTGLLGFEAASRGASSVYMVETHAGLCKQLQHNKQLLEAHSVHIQQGDALPFLRQLAKTKQEYFDVIFLDPPYTSTLYKPALQAIVPLLKSSGVVYLEADHAWNQEALTELGWQCWRYTKVGLAHAHLLRFLT